MTKKDGKEGITSNRIEYMNGRNMFDISKLREISHDIKDIDFYLFLLFKTSVPVTSRWVGSIPMHFRQ